MIDRIANQLRTRITATKVIKKYFFEIAAYGIIGVLTTIIDYGVYWLLVNILAVNYIIANIAAWVTAVTFAFPMNKVFVFKSRKWSLDLVKSECVTFISSRMITGILETLLLYLLVDIVELNKNYAKIIALIIFTITNYLIGKFVVFNPNNRKLRRDFRNE